MYYVYVLIVLSSALQWCESRPECNRLDLKAYLAKPMQRLTKYPLLISAIAKKTIDPATKQRLDQIVGYVICGS